MKKKMMKIQTILKKVKYVLAISAIMMSVLQCNVFAADPLGTINSLSDFIFQRLKQ